MGAVISLIFAEITIIVQSALAIVSATKSSGQARMYNIISSVVGALAFIVSLAVAIFLL